MVFLVWTDYSRHQSDGELELPSSAVGNTKHPEWQNAWGLGRRVQSPRVRQHVAHLVSQGEG